MMEIYLLGVVVIGLWITYVITSQWNKRKLDTTNKLEVIFGILLTIFWPVAAISLVTQEIHHYFLKKWNIFK